MQDAAALPLGWMRWLETHRGRAALGGWALVLALYVASAAWAGHLDGLVDAGSPLLLRQAFRFNVVALAVLAYTLWARLDEAGAVRADLGDLRPGYGPGTGPYREVARALHGPRARLAGAAGAAVGLAIVLYSESLDHAAASAAANGWYLDFHERWNALIMLVLFGLMGSLGYASLRTSRVFSDLGAAAEVRLLDPGSVRVFARRGLRMARHWLLGSALAGLLFPGATQPGVVAAVLTVTLGLAGVSLVRPGLGVHRRLRALKQVELARVRRRIARRSEALLAGAGAAEDDPELPSLLAYEARIEAVSEWPFDAPVLVRFALFLLIPLGSWLGGALVERLVDTVLD